MTNIITAKVADLTILAFDFLQKDVEGWTLFEKIIGGPLDIRSFKLTDYIQNANNDSEWTLDIGAGWNLKIEYEDNPFYYAPHTYASPSKSLEGLNIGFDYNGKYSSYFWILVENGNIVVDMAPSTVAEVFKELVRNTKRRVTSVYREHTKYMAKQAYYDMLVKEFNITLKK